MSVQKLVSEADRLLEKGKAPEAIEKLKQALRDEPLNQFVGTKLSALLVDSGDKSGAVKVLVTLAEKLSDAGKSQVAIAIFKQAIDLDPTNIDLKVKYTRECESVGKLGDALGQGQIALQYYLRRKKYFDAANLMPVLVRIQPKDEKLKQAWLEVMQFAQADQKLIHLLVALCGPPGLVSQEFSVGGDPVNLSPSLYESLKRLVAFFPRDAKIAYAVAWAAYRREKLTDYFVYLKECLRRDPDFTLALLHLARHFADQQKLNESFFVYKHLRDRMAVDKNVDMLTLNQLVDAFVQKNGWISFAESGDPSEELDAATFLDTVKGIVKKEEVQEADTFDEASNDGMSRAEDTSAPMNRQTGSMKIPAPAEIELSSSTLPSSGGGALEIELSGGQTKVVPIPDDLKKMLESEAKPTAPPIKHTPAPAAATESSSTLQENTDSVLLTSIIRVDPQELSKGESPGLLVEEEASKSNIAVPVPAAAPATTAPPSAPAATAPNPPASKPLESSPPTATAPTPVRPTFNPFAAPVEEAKVEASDPREQEVVGEKTMVFSPMDVLNATNVRQQAELAKVATKIIDSPSAPAVPTPSPATASQGGADLGSLVPKYRNVSTEGDPTELYSPVEALKATEASRKSAQDASIPPPIVPPVQPTSSVSISTASEASVAQDTDISAVWPSTVNIPSPTSELSVGGTDADNEPTTIVNRNLLEESLNLSPPQAEEEATTIVRADQIPPAIASNELAMDVSASSSLSLESSEAPIEKGSAIEPAALVLPESHEIPAAPLTNSPPIPPPLSFTPSSSDLPPPASIASEEVVDLGDDLLEGPTKILVRPPSEDVTEHLIREIREEVKEIGDKPVADSNFMLRKAERYIAKRNYYLARKALRHALALGADEAHVKAKLTEIRKIELPDSLYYAVSNDQKQIERSSEILERLESEFELADDSFQDEEQELALSMEEKLDAIVNENDPRTILDFGIGLHEMGLYKQAEHLFSKAIDRFPEISFDAYYLSAIAKFSRKDYAGAASILKKLSGDAGRAEHDKIQVYYALAETFEMMRQSDRSQAFYKKVAEIDPNYRNVRVKLEE